ncbi:MAG TPA: hypothetical protein VLE19_00450 [Pyrinomonadaceae bacterium]|nr:hypothetical protein [Pyrinomonadaceae bacterium]
MSTPDFGNALDRLDQLKTQFGPKPAQRIVSLLRRIARLRITDADLLLRLHELLLFIRAYPHNPSVLKAADEALLFIQTRVVHLRNSEVDLSGLEHPEVSGIAGTAVIDTFSYQIVCWLLRQRSAQVAFDWDWFEDQNRLAAAWPRFMPLLEEDSYVEASVPYREWLGYARGSQDEVTWLLNQFSKLKKSDLQKAELYDAQKLYVRWQFNYRDSRTGLRLPVKTNFYHETPLIQRRDVDLRAELTKPFTQLERLSTREGRAAIDMALTASTVRYRELYGFTNGDPASVYKTELGRGVELLIFTLPPAKRLPLRAYHSAMIYKNGVPVGYFEGLSLFERMESGFNLYYTFREGETAWLYARVLSVMRNLTGVTAFSLDPYQIGHENEEGIQSGAFWFYRKLGFRSTQPSIQRLTEVEEAKMLSRRNHRTSAAMLRRLAEAQMIFELDQTRRGDWDRFQIRNLGFALQRLMAREFKGNVNLMRSHGLALAAKTLGLEGKSDIGDIAVILLLLDNLQAWSKEDLCLLRNIIETKRTGLESKYLRLLQKHVRLRDELIKIGSGL